MATKLIATDLDFQGTAKAINLQAPTAAGDAATKAYVDAAIEGMAWKDNVRVATQANISIASPGAAIDGITLATNDRVLVRAQTNQTENGIYIWNGAAVPMTRSADASTFDELENATVSVDEGTASGGTTWRQSAVNGVIGTNNVIWGSFGTSAPAASDTTAGILRLATQSDVDTGTVTDEAVTPATLNNWSKAKKLHSQDFGDGSATSYTITHNLNTRDLHVQVRQTTGTFDEVICEIEYTSLTQITLKFNTAPAANSLRVIVLG